MAAVAMAKGRDLPLGELPDFTQPGLESANLIVKNVPSDETILQ
jgi:hypothetical protein